MRPYRLSRETWHALRRLTDIDGRPMCEPAAVEGEPDTYMGVPVEVHG